MKIRDLHGLYLEYPSVSTDTRKIKKNDLFFALKGDNFNGNSFAKKALDTGARFAIIEDIEYASLDNTILVDDVLKCLQELATFHRNYLKTPIIALTGSNGKTTTKELINSVLSAKYRTVATVGNLNNHIGVPLTLLSMTGETEIGIIEMGANHQGEIKFLCNVVQPDYGYITNFGKAHLEGFGGVEGVIKGKSELYNYLSDHNKTVFVNNNDPIQVEKTRDMNTYTFGSSNSVNDVTINFITAKPFVTSSFLEHEIASQLIGEYNFSNICAAIAMGHHFGVNKEAITKAIEDYVPQNNRSQLIEKDGIKIIMDAYNANPTSMRAALLHFDQQSGKKIALLGDMFELGEDAEMEHQAIADLANSLEIDKLYFIGNNFSKSKIRSNIAKQFDSFEDFKQDFNPKELQNSTLLIKGSRGMALERVLDLLN